MQLREILVLPYFSGETCFKLSERNVQNLHLCYFKTKCLNFFTKEQSLSFHQYFKGKILSNLENHDFFQSYAAFIIGTVDFVFLTITR